MLSSRVYKKKKKNLFFLFCFCRCDPLYKYLYFVGNMEAVEKFLSLRRSGQGDEAFALLSSGASLGCPWGGMHRGDRVRELLHEESKFVKKGYLNDVCIERLGEDTFQRIFKWDRGMGEGGNSGFFGWGALSLWREVYYVKDGKIRLVTSDKMRKNRCFLSFLGLRSLT